MPFRDVAFEAEFRPGNVHQAPREGDLPVRVFGLLRGMKPWAQRRNHPKGLASLVGQKTGQWSSLSTLTLPAPLGSAYAGRWQRFAVHSVVRSAATAGGILIFLILVGGAGFAGCRLSAADQLIIWIMVLAAPFVVSVFSTRGVWKAPKERNAAAMERREEVKSLPVRPVVWSGDGELSWRVGRYPLVRGSRLLQEMQPTTSRPNHPGRLTCRMNQLSG